MILKKLSLFITILACYLIFSTPTHAASNKRIEINLTNQQLYAFEGDKLVYNFPVSTGKPRTPTPTGEFKPWVKLRSTRMRGPGYDLPNVPYTIYFHQGYGIHGAYWHNNFGSPMSHGCVNVHPTNMASLYNWAPMDVSIKIYGSTPQV